MKEFFAAIGVSALILVGCYGAAAVIRHFDRAAEWEDSVPAPMAAPLPEPPASGRNIKFYSGFGAAPEGFFNESQPRVVYVPIQAKWSLEGHDDAIRKATPNPYENGVWVPGHWEEPPAAPETDREDPTA